jgi:hypothetical protein
MKDPPPDGPCGRIYREKHMANHKKVDLPLVFGVVVGLFVLTCLVVNLTK